MTLWHLLIASVSIRRFASAKPASVAHDSQSAKCWDIWPAACLKRKSWSVFLSSHTKTCWPVLLTPRNESVARFQSLPLEGLCGCCWTKTFPNPFFPH
jgi:hypothetical protein